MAPFDVLFTKWDVVEPDLLFIAADQAEILTDANVTGAPALVVEVLSQRSKTDEQVKRRLFESGGVREYWLVDPEHDRVTVFRRQPEGSSPCVAELSREQRDALTTPLLSGLELHLDRLFA